MNNSIKIPFETESLTLSSAKASRNLGNLALTVTLLCFSTFYFGFCLTFISTIPKQTLEQYFGSNAGNN